MGKREKSLAGGPLLGVVDRIYQGAVDPHAWTGIVADLVSYVGGSTGVLVTNFTGPTEGGFAFLHAIPETFLQQWAVRYREQDLWAKATAEKGLYREGSTVLDSELVSEDVFLRSAFYREFLKPQGIARLCAGVIFGQESPGVLPTACSVMRAREEPRFGDKERARMRQLLPHLSRALGVMFRLRDAELKVAATLSALDRLASGVILLDSAGAAAHANVPALRILARQEGLSLQLGEREHLIAAEPDTQFALDASIAAALANDVSSAPHFSSSVSVPRPFGKPPLLLQCAPLPESSPFSAGPRSIRGILFITDPANRPAPDAQVLKRLYGITPAETRLATALCGGESLQDAAQRCSITEATARTQLRSVFEKTGTHRQADLVRLLLSLASDCP